MPLVGLSTAQSVAAIVGTAVCGLLICRRLARSSGRLDTAGTGRASSIEPHEVAEVKKKVKAFASVAEEVQGRMAFRLSYEPVADDAPAGPGHKIVHFVRHGEGRHNVAQRQWRASPLWDGHSEPYTLDTDPTGRYIDAELTVRGVQQAVALRARTARLCPDLLIVSPMRRATQTALLAFAPHVAACAMPIIAHELAHETAGRHTCDRRLSRTALATAFPAVSYSEVHFEEDPFWADGITRESSLSLATRAAAFADWLAARPETRMAVVAHSGFLCAMMTAVLVPASHTPHTQPHPPPPRIDHGPPASTLTGMPVGAVAGALAVAASGSEDQAQAWFGTGEMRTLRLHVQKK